MNLPNGYVFLDPEDHGGAACAMARQHINLCGRKDVEIVIGTDDDDPEVAGALFVGWTKDAFSFDVVVHQDHRRKGLARAMVEIAIYRYEELKDAYDKDFRMEIDVVSPDMARILKSMGFEIDKRMGKNHVQMTMESPVIEAARMMTKAQKRMAKRSWKYARRRDMVEKFGVPSFEDVWNDARGTLAFDRLFASMLDDKSYKMEFKDATGKNANLNSQDYQDWILENVMKDIVKDRYSEVVHFVRNEMDGSDCWRAVGIPEKIDPAKHERLGIYWASEKSGADEYEGNRDGTIPCVYRARIDRNNVDVFDTVHARMDLDLGEVEWEVKMIPGSRIFVYDVQVMGKMGTKDFGFVKETIRINDWRYA